MPTTTATTSSDGNNAVALQEFWKASKTRLLQGALDRGATLSDLQDFCQRLVAEGSTLLIATDSDTATTGLERKRKAGPEVVVSASEGESEAEASGEHNTQKSPKTSVDPESDQRAQEEEEAAPASAPSSPPTVISPVSSALSSSSSPQTNASASASTTSAAIPSCSIEELEHKYRDLLFDTHGNQRAAFLQAPPAWIELLQDAWNLPKQQHPLQEPEGQPDTKNVDRISKRLLPVQSYSRNLINYALPSAGLPSALFRGGSNSKQDTEARVCHASFELQHALCQKLAEMGYLSPDHQWAEFHLTFLRTLEWLAQDPHIDFAFDTVDPPTNEEETLSESNRSTSRRSRSRTNTLPYKERVPFVGFFPLTVGGMRLELWKARACHDQMPLDNNHHEGVMVELPLGVMLLARGDVIHAGGFLNPTTLDNPVLRGDPRGHLFVYRSNGEKHAINLSNTYTYRGQRLTQFYKHCPGAWPWPVPKPKAGTAATKTK